jgi:hypothetical protein
MLELSNIIAAGVARYRAEQAKYAPPLADVAELETTPNVSAVDEDRQRELCLSCPLSDCVGIENATCPIRAEARRLWRTRFKR